MNINQLPPEILVQIIRPLVSVTMSPYFTRQDSLRLMAVCRKWRALTLPLAYKWIYVYYFPKRASTSILDSREDRDRIYHPSHVSLDPVLEADVISDLDILPKGYERYVSGLHLEMVHCTNISKGMHLMLNRLDNNRSMCLKMKQLQVHILPASYDMQHNSQYNSELEKAKKVAKRLVCTLPNIQSYVSRQHNSSRLITAFRQELVRLLSPRLNKIKAGSIVISENAKFSDKLKSLVIQDPIGGNLLATPVHAESLKLVDMFGINPRFDWSLFTNSSDLSEPVNFEQLEHLNLSMDIDETGHPGLRATNLRILAPRVNHIRLGFYPYLLSVLSKIKLPDTVEKITLVRNASIVSNLYDVSISSALMKLFSVYSMVCNSPEIDHISLINDICRIPSVPRHIEIRIIKRLSVDHIGRISWPAVTALDIESLIDFDIVLRLISAMPRLNRLKIHRADFTAERFNDLEYICPSRLEAYFPTQRNTFTTNLKHIAVRVMTSAPKTPIYSMIRKYMLENIGSLQSFSIIPDTQEESSYDIYYLNEV